MGPCSYTALSLYPPCTHNALSLHSHCTLTAPSQYPPSTQHPPSTLPLHPLYTPSLACASPAPSLSALSRGQIGHGRLRLGELNHEAPTLAALCCAGTSLLCTAFRSRRPTT